MIEELKKLSECDREIFLARRRLEEIPVADRRAADELAAQKALLEAEEKKTRELEISQKSAELDIESREAENSKKQARLLEVKTNRDYTALTAEIARLKEEISTLEERALALLDEISAGKERCREAASVFGAREKVTREKREKLAEEKKGLLEKIDRLEAGRPALAAAVKPEARRAYERILGSRKDGLAMVRLVDGNCGGCLTRVATSAREMARRRDRLIYCEQCNRIVYYEEEA